MARKSSYTPELGEKICKLIREGHSERQISKMKGMPSVVTMSSWKDKHPEFLKQSVRAREASAEIFDDLAREACEEVEATVNEARMTRMDVPRGVMEGYKILIQEYARQAGIRNDALFGDRKKVTVNMTDSDGDGLKSVYEKIRKIASGEDDED